MHVFDYNEKASTNRLVFHIAHWFRLLLNFVDAPFVLRQTKFPRNRVAIIAFVREITCELDDLLQDFLGDWPERPVFLFFHSVQTVEHRVPETADEATLTRNILQRNTRGNLPRSVVTTWNTRCPQQSHVSRLQFLHKITFTCSTCVQSCQVLLQSTRERLVLLQIGGQAVFFPQEPIGHVGADVVWMGDVFQVVVVRNRHQICESTHGCCIQWFLEGVLPAAWYGYIDSGALVVGWNRLQFLHDFVPVYHLTCKWKGRDEHVGGVTT